MTGWLAHEYISQRAICNPADYGRQSPRVRDRSEIVFAPVTTPVTALDREGEGDRVDETAIRGE